MKLEKNFVAVKKVFVNLTQCSPLLRGDSSREGKCIVSENFPLRVKEKVFRA
jgi:hypothetical protein